VIASNLVSCGFGSINAVSSYTALGVLVDLSAARACWFCLLHFGVADDVDGAVERAWHRSGVAVSTHRQFLLSLLLVCA